MRFVKIFSDNRPQVLEEKINAFLMDAAPQKTTVLKVEQSQSVGNNGPDITMTLLCEVK